MSAPATTITAEQHEELRRFVERAQATFSIQRADNRTLRLAHAGMRESLYDVLTLIGAGHHEEAFDVVRTLMTVAEIHAHGMRDDVLPAGVIDLDEVRGRRIAAAMGGRPL